MPKCGATISGYRKPAGTAKHPYTDEVKRKFSKHGEPVQRRKAWFVGEFGEL
jgi:hypothetical protein